MPKSDIPMGSEFGPNQVDLVTVLELAQKHSGSGQEFIEAVASKYGWPPATAKNTRLSMRRYLLLDDKDQLTDLGRKLLAGIFRADSKFDSLDMNRVTQLIGATQEETDFLAEMPEDQRAILKALCNLPIPAVLDNEPLLANKIMEYAEALYGVTFNPKN